MEHGIEKAIWNVVQCANVGKDCAALLAELVRLYEKAGEPLPAALKSQQCPPILEEGLDAGSISYATSSERWFGSS